MNCRLLLSLRCFFLASGVLLFGCGQRTPHRPAVDRLVVPVSRPVQRLVTDYADYTGRTAAIHSVDVRPRVTGYLIKMPFQEGADVKEGDLLFEIDPRPYQAQVDVAKGSLERLEGEKKLLQLQVTRYTNMVEKGAASQQDLDTFITKLAENAGGLISAKSQLAYAMLNLQFCTIRAPINGQISRYFLTSGNLVNQDETQLTTIVSLDPIYAYFDMDDRTLLRIRRKINEGKIKPFPPADPMHVLGGGIAGLNGTLHGAGPLLTAAGLFPGTTPSPIYMGLDGEVGYPHQGFVDFVNNQITASTGTISVRGVFQNPKPKDGVRLIPPGLFVRIHVPLGEPEPALLVIDRAVGSDQGLKFVYVVDEQHRVQYRRVQTGPLQPDGLRVIEEGLKPDDWVVIGALERIRPPMEVTTEAKAMPTVKSP